LVLEANNNLGLLLKDEGRAAEAEPFLRDTLGRAGARLGTAHPMTLMAAAALGEAEAGEGHGAEGEKRAAETLAAARRTLPQGSAATGKVLRSYGRCLALLGRRADAEAALTEGRSSFTTAEPVQIPATDADLSALRRAPEKS
jgi:hypothetical protein